VGHFNWHNGNSVPYRNDDPRCPDKRHGRTISKQQLVKWQAGYVHNIVMRITGICSQIKESCMCETSYLQRHGTLLITIIRLASKTSKTHIFENVLLSTRRPHGRIIMNVFRKLKLSCTCHNSTSISTPQSLKQGESETTLGPDLHSTFIIRSTIPFRKCFKSWSRMSDHVTRYGLHETMIYTYLVMVPFEHDPSKSECI